jgi:hypothetical protein
MGSSWDENEQRLRSGRCSSSPRTESGDASRFSGDDVACAPRRQLQIRPSGPILVSAKRRSRSAPSERAKPHCNLSATRGFAAEAVSDLGPQDAYLTVEF